MLPILRQSLYTPPGCVAEVGGVAENPPPLTLPYPVAISLTGGPAGGDYFDYLKGVRAGNASILRGELLRTSLISLLLP